MTSTTSFIRITGSADGACGQLDQNRLEVSVCVSRLDDLMREGAAELGALAGHKHERRDDGGERFAGTPHTVPPVKEEGVPRVSEASRRNRFRSRWELIT